MNSNDLEYCMFCAHGVQSCFGSIGLRRNRFCILNREYRPDEYKLLRGKIVRHMQATGEYGRFFPAKLSPHPYNKSTALMHFPLSKSQALGRGFRWDDDIPSEPGEPRILPDSIDQVDDTFCNEVFTCNETGARYRIIKQELKFYRAHRLPVPTIAPMARITRQSRYGEIRSARTVACGKCAEPTLTYEAGGIRELYCERCFAELRNRKH